jgi:hypothetical protein
MKSSLEQEVIPEWPYLFFFGFYDSPLYQVAIARMRANKERRQNPEDILAALACAAMGRESRLFQIGGGDEPFAGYPLAISLAGGGIT